MSTFEQKVSTIEGNLVKEDNKTEVVLFKAFTGAGKTNEVQKLIIDSLEKDSEKVFVVLFSTLHELDNFYIDLKIKYDNASSTIKPFNCVVKRTSLNKSYPSAHLTDLETLTLSHYKITGISKWMKSRLLNTSSSNTDVFLLSSVYTYPIDYSFKVSGVWAEILLFIEYRKYVSTLEEKQLKLKLKSGKEITIVNSEILKINKSILTEGEIQTYLFIDEADRYIKSSVLQTLKVDKLSFKGGGISFKERLRKRDGARNALKSGPKIVGKGFQKVKPIVQKSKCIINPRTAILELIFGALSAPYSAMAWEIPNVQDAAGNLTVVAFLAAAVE